MSPRSTKPTALTRKHIARLERERRQSRIIIWSAVAVVAIVAGLLGYALLNEYVLKPNQPVARVGEDKITTEQFQARVRLQRENLINQYAEYAQFGQMFGMDVSAQLQQMEYQLSAEASEFLGQAVLDAMISETLLKQEAERQNTVVTEQDIDERLQTLFRYFPNGEPTATATPTEVVFPPLSTEQAAIVSPTPAVTATPTGTPEPPEPTATITLTPDLTTTPTITFTPTVTFTPTATLVPTATVTPSATASPAPTSTPQPTATPLTEEGYKESLNASLQAFTEMGLTEADYRGLVRDEILRERFFEIVTADIKPVEEQVWARHILLLDEDTALDARRRLLRGDDFAVVASELSLDTSNKDSGGNLDWFSRGVMAAEFEKAAFSQRPGEIGNPVKTEFGWHIIQVIGHEDRPLTADQYDQARQTAFQTWLDGLRTTAEEAGLITIFDYWKERIPLDPDLASAFGQ